MAHTSPLISFAQSETISIPFEPYSDILAGISWADFSKKWFSESEDSAIQAAVTSLKSRFAIAGQYLLSDENTPCSDRSTPLCPLEVLWLKWQFFSEITNDLIDFQEQQNRPYLNLSPQCLQIKIPAQANSIVPARWPLQLDLDPTHAAPAFSSKIIPPELSQHLFLPKKEARTLYQSPAIQGQNFAEVVSGVVSVRKLERRQDTNEISEDSIRGLVSFHFIAENLQNNLVSEEDVFLTQLFLQGDMKPAIEIWCTGAQILEKGLLLKGTTNSMAREIWDQFKTSQTRVFSQATLTHYPAYPRSSDLYSLGMILFHLLLVNASQNIKKVNEALQELIPRIPPMVQGLRSEDRHILSKRFESLLGEYGVLFSRSAVFYLHETQPTRLPEIPDGLWIEALILGFRLITDIPDFSIGREDFDEALSKPRVFSVKTLAPRILALSKGLKQALFEPRSRRAEIEAVCDLLRKEQIAGVTQNNGL